MDDALCCAYLAFFFWRWSFERSEMLGTVDDGYIVNPRLRLAMEMAPEVKS